jgi:ankyrin repeat protein
MASDLNATAMYKATPMHRAAAWGNVLVVKELVAAGARTDIKDLNGRTPLAEALWNGSRPETSHGTLQVVEFLLRVPGANPFDTDSLGKSMAALAKRWATTEHLNAVERAVRLLDTHARGGGPFDPGSG